MKPRFYCVHIFAYLPMGKWFKYLFKGYERFRWYYRLCCEIESLICFDRKCPQRLLFTFKSIRSVLAATKHLNWCYLKIVISHQLLLAKRKTKKIVFFIYFTYCILFTFLNGGNHQSWFRIIGRRYGYY